MYGFKLRYLPLVLLPLTLGGCISPEEQRAMDQDKCSSYGFRPGTDNFAKCMMSQDRQRAEDEQRSLDRMRAQEQRDRERKAARRNSDDDIDTRPSFDRDGNPNFDTQGNYQGCHGIGCEVDNPDAD